ncbi:MAG TPA: beta-xylosidase [Opitutaceae bacterium]|jgi:xylan 1,4-beta-xylosidase
MKKVGPPGVARLRFGIGALIPLVIAAAAALEPTSAAFPVQINVAADSQVGDWRPVWRYFGADEPNYATMKDGRRLLGELGALDHKGVFFRAHNLLTTGNGTPALKWGSTNAYTEDSEGRPIYDWTILDGIFDAYRQNGIRPYVEIGFMPEALSIHPKPYQHHWRPDGAYGDIGTGWSYPPSDYRKWAELVYRWVRHDVDRYGASEVKRWYWEVWNEPNLKAYWHGSPDDFFKLHDFAVDAVRRAFSEARVGGPDCAGGGGEFMRRFLEHCASGTNYATGARGTPVDFISFHAKGRPEYVDGHVRMGIAAQLKDIDSGFALVASFQELRNKPIVIGESDPDGCAACQGPQLGYRPGPLYASYTTACIAREFDIARKRGVNLEGALTWAFEFENQPYFSGQRVLATEGIDLPILNLFRMLSKMGGRRVAATSSGEASLAAILAGGVRGAPDVGVRAAVAPGQLSVLVWHYHDDDVPGPDADVRLSVAGLPQAPASVEMEHYRIDERHSNAFAAWKEMGTPREPAAAQYAALQLAGLLAELSAAPERIRVVDGRADLRFSLPRAGVSLLVFRWGERAAAAADERGIGP